METTSYMYALLFIVQGSRYQQQHPHPCDLAHWMVLVCWGLEICLVGRRQKKRRYARLWSTLVKEQREKRKSLQWTNDSVNKWGDGEWKYSACKCVRNGKTKGRSKWGKMNEGQNMKNTYLYLRAHLLEGYKFHAYKFCGPCTKHFCHAHLWHKIIWVGEECSLPEVLQQHHLEKHSMATCITTTPIGVYSCPVH